MNARRKSTVGWLVWSVLPGQPWRLCAALALLGVPAGANAGDAVPAGKALPQPAVRSSAELLARSAEFLDRVTLTWLKQRKCASCHTGYPFLLARSAIGNAKAPAVREVRRFFEERVAAWDKGGKGAGYLKGGGSLDVSEGVTEVVAIAATLALHDSQATGKLAPVTRQALARMWELQQKNGSWPWNKTRLAPLEVDDYFGAVYAALGVGHAPEGYARSAAAKEGVARLKAYLRKEPPPNLHHQTWLLWASVKLDGLVTPTERAQTINRLLAVQREDGGWCLPSLGNWKRLNGKPNGPDAPSDGYATGLVLYVLRQAGMPASRESMRRGVSWLKTHQQPSGRWFTRSLNADRAHYITNAGTALAMLALKACETPDK